MPQLFLLKSIPCSSLQDSVSDSSTSCSLLDLAESTLDPGFEARCLEISGADEGAATLFSSKQGSALGVKLCMHVEFGKLLPCKGRVSEACFLSSVDGSSRSCSLLKSCSGLDLFQGGWPTGWVHCSIRKRGNFAETCTPRSRHKRLL